MISIMSLLAFSAYSSDLEINAPEGISSVEILSGGTKSMLEHIKDRFDGQLSALEQRYKISELKEEHSAATEHLKTRKTAYTTQIKSLKAEYLSNIEITIHSLEAEISPESSALGDIMFFFTIKNKTDKIISQITYKPMAEDLYLPTTTNMVLELIDPKTMKLGISPGKSLSNVGHEPVKLSIFINQLKKDEVGRIKSDIKNNFAIAILDAKFSNAIGYKGQHKMMDLKEAIAAKINAFRIAIEKAEKDEGLKKKSYEKALAAYTKEQDEINKLYKKNLEELKVSSLRFSTGSEDNTIEDIPPGNYIIYARNTDGKAVFQEVKIEGKKTSVDLQNMEGDPFQL